MADNHDTAEDNKSSTRRAAWIVGSWLGSHAVIIAGHVLLVFLYSIAVAPGLGSDAYEAFALSSGPWFSIVFGGPVFYLVAHLLHKRFGPDSRRMALVAWGLYSATDLAIVLLAGTTYSSLFTAQWILSQSVKLVAVLFATRSRLIKS